MTPDLVESMADWSPSRSSDTHQDSNQDCLGFGKSQRLFHSANWAKSATDWLENLLKNSRYVLPDLTCSSAMAGETLVSFWELLVQSTQTFSWQSSWWKKLLRISFPATQWIICCWISHDDAEGIHIRWDEGQIMKVINLKKQPKNELPAKFSSLEDETKSSLSWICN